MDRSRLAPLLLFGGFLFLGILLAMQWQSLPESFSFRSSLSFAKLTKAVHGADGSFAAVFHSNKRIARLDARGNLLYQLQPRNSADHGFFSANEIALAADGRLFVASTYIDPDTLSVNREAIVRFSPSGSYEGIVFTLNHDPEQYVDNSGVIRGIQLTSAGLRFCIAGDRALHSYLLDPIKGTIHSQVTFPTFHDSDQILYAAASEDGQELAFTTAATEIFTVKAGQAPVKRYDGRDIEEVSIPSEIHYFNRVLFFTDLGRDSVSLLSGEESRPTTVFNAAIAGKRGYQDAFLECKSFQIDAAGLTLANNGKIVFAPADTAEKILVLHQARGGLLFWGKRIVLWIQMLLFAVFTVLLLQMIIAHATPEGLVSTRRTAMTALMVVTAIAITALMVFNDLNKRIVLETGNNLQGYLEVGQLVIDPEAIARIRHVQDYMNDDYQAILAQLRQTITRDNAIAASTYSGIYTIHGNKLVTLAYHDGLRGIFYPYDYQYDKSIYAKIAAMNETYVGEMVDIYGTWLIGVQPLHDSRDNLVGFLEVGIDQSAYREANRSLMKSTLVALAMVLFVLVFIFSELLNFTAGLCQRGRRAAENALWRYDEGMLRFLAFLALTGIFLSASFLPLYSKSLASPMPPLPLEMVVGLPLVVEALIGAISAMLYGLVHIRLGLKHDIALGSLIVAAGMAVTAATSTFIGLMLGRATVGIGMGLLMIAFRTYVRSDQDGMRQHSGFGALSVGVTAGINAGSVLGGMLADQFGMDMVFWLQAALLTLTAFFALVLLRNRWQPRPEASAPMPLTAFFLDTRIVAFLLLAFLPVIACGSFLGFLFPLVAESRGLGFYEISLAFMLFGVGSVFPSPALTRLTAFLFGARGALAAGALLMVCGLLIFASTQTLAAAHVTVFLFGVANSFMFNQGRAYFTALPGVQRLGEDKAMEVYRFFEAGGKSMGPVAFGLAMSVNLGLGISAIALLLAAGAGLFLLLSRPPHKKHA